jgi:hypothetical protein
MRALSVIVWAFTLGLAVAIWLNLTETVPGGDSVTSLALAQVLMLVVAFRTDGRRRRTIGRIYRVPEGLVFEMQGMLGTLRRYVRTEDFGRIRATPPDVKGRMQLRLPDGGKPLIMHTGHAGFNLGLPEPKHKKRR